MKYIACTIGIIGFLIGCNELDDTESLGSTNETLQGDNGLGFNSIRFNRDAFALLATEPLSTSEDQHGRLILNPEIGLPKTGPGRTLLRYAVHCALAPSDTLAYGHGAHVVELSGRFGVAPTWASAPLTTEQRMVVSSCLLAHVNALGARVWISVRTPGAIATTAAEFLSHPVYEGTFFGDLFEPSQLAYACLGSEPEIAAAHAPDRSLRVCADSTDTCPIEVIGRCRDVCETFVDNQGWRDCWADGRRYHDTASVYLYDPDVSLVNADCDVGGTCRFETVNDDGVFDCTDSRRCLSECRSDAVCTITGGNTEFIQTVTQDHSRSETGCQGAGDCRTVCDGDSICDIDCFQADACHANQCTGGAACLLDCTGARNCRFAVCEGTQTVCADDVVVCNRPCP